MTHHPLSSSTTLFRPLAEPTEVSPPETVAATEGGSESATAGGGGGIVAPAPPENNLIGDLLSLDLPTGGAYNAAPAGERERERLMSRVLYLYNR